MLNSPPLGYSNSGQPPARDTTVDNIFDEFVAQPEEDLNHRSEVVEALEDRGREHENESGANPLEEFVP